MTMTREMLSARQTGRAMLMAVFGAGFFAAAGCGSAAVEHEYPEQIGASDQHDPTGSRRSNSDEEVGSLLDEEGLVGGLFKGDDDKGDGDKGDGDKGGGDKGDDGERKKNTEEETAAAADERAETKAKRDLHNPEELGVNSYLWRATLDTLSFMPLSSADPYGGVIITDWSTNPEAPRERFKVTVYILDKKLRADGVKVSVFRQVLSDEGVWVDQPAADETKLQIESAILTRARQLRVAKLNED